MFGLSRGGSLLSNGKGWPSLPSRSIAEVVSHSELLHDAMKGVLHLRQMHVHTILIYIYTYLNIYIYTYIYICMYIHAYIYIHMQICVYNYMCRCIYIHMCMCICIYICAYRDPNSYQSTRGHPENSPGSSREHGLFYRMRDQMELSTSWPPTLRVQRT